MIPESPVRRRTLQGLAALLAAVCLGGAGPAQAQGVELASLRASRTETSIDLEFAARVILPRAVDEALARGVPIYFTAEAILLRQRWYWRDERVARISRTWRIAFQPLTGSWRVGLGGLNQTHHSLAEALSAASRSAGWKLADLSQVDPDKSYHVAFEYRLDTALLPSPMQFGLSLQGDWAVGVTRVVPVR